MLPMMPVKWSPPGSTGRGGGLLSSGRQPAPPPLHLPAPPAPHNSLSICSELSWIASPPKVLAAPRVIPFLPPRPKNLISIFFQASATNLTSLAPLLNSKNNRLLQAKRALTCCLHPQKILLPNQFPLPPAKGKKTPELISPQVMQTAPLLNAHAEESCAPICINA